MRRSESGKIDFNIGQEISPLTFVPEGSAIDADVSKNKPRLTTMSQTPSSISSSIRCFRCGDLGHRAGDQICSLRTADSIILAQRQTREDPMSAFMANKMLKRKEKYDRVAQLMALVAEIREEERVRLKAKEAKRKQKKKNKHVEEPLSSRKRRREFDNFEEKTSSNIIGINECKEES